MDILTGRWVAGLVCPNAMSEHPMDIELEISDAIALVTLAAPQRRNALTVGMAQALTDVLRQVDASPEIGVVILRGAGGYFCAGGDLRTLAAAAQDPADDLAFRNMGAIYQMFVVLGAMSVPTIAAVRGGAVGAGLNLAIATDVRIVGRSAVLDSGFLRIGAHPGGGHFQLLESLVGRQMTAAMTLLGERIDGVTAERIGLALEAVDDDMVEARALELAGRVRDPALTRLATESFRLQSHSNRISWPVALRAEQAVQMWSLRRAADRLGVVAAKTAATEPATEARA
jgi:enoyl-CoA hydratase